MNFPLKFTRSLWPTKFKKILSLFDLLILSVKQTYTITFKNKLIFKSAFAHLRYFLGGDRPSQTTSHKLFIKLSKAKI